MGHLPIHLCPRPIGAQIPTYGQALQALAVLRWDGVPVREGRHIRAEDLWPAQSTLGRLTDGAVTTKP